MIEARRTSRGIIAALTALVLLTGCGQVEPVELTEPVTDPVQLYVQLRLNYNAINLTADSTVPAYNEVQLVATPYDGNGMVIPDAPTATFTTSDTSAIRLEADGLLHAKQAADGVRVVATLVLGNVQHTDTAVVNISSSASPPIPDTLSIRVPADSAAWYVRSQTGQFITELLTKDVGLAGPVSLPVRLVDAGGNPIPPGLVIEYVPLDSAVAIVNRWDGTATPLSAGRVAIVARTFAYGVEMADTMTYVVNAPLTGDIRIDRHGFFYRPDARPPAPTLRIVAGGIVGWYSFTAQPMDITFDNPTNVTAPPTVFCDYMGPGPHCGTGNIAAFVGDSIFALASPATWRFRQFPVPGTYPYRSTTTGAAGTVVVLDRVSPLP